ncbi:P-loop containing nucleoside triphosphate hydrolase protein [Fomitiporia mediterranea MF3/22]|uniref:P-loop containing nucleoside triphosphate hydrolase protein n=1 Tax=Fomitiporia mediterranea (strain MF3/22) TaxID=694068 RepID=UPI000440971E|nr:P-loop containing nucleoside triphosphate hydrolase protein [Fomitiporia mediterranea MF3/22]EJD03414.1 P-loop containing nucleoside triphosphate hydrolase protein [Fomitiporia mediterranea MF3/22]
MNTADSSGQRQRVILVGVGGATCSGKTTLAKHLRRCILNSIIIHQDDFAPPQELVPVHPEYGVQDWDDAPGAIDWPRMRAFLKKVKETGVIPDSHKSHDHLNEQKDVPLNDETFGRWKELFDNLAKRYEQNGENIVWGLVDGFLLYWDTEIIDLLDARIFLRVSYDALKQRRHERHGYHTAVQSDPEGSLWRDPPNYFDQIVYPAYVRAHTRMFENGDFEHGEPSDFVPRLVVIDCEELSMDEVFERSAQAVWEVSKIE